MHLATCQGLPDGDQRSRQVSLLAVVCRASAACYWRSLVNSYQGCIITRQLYSRLVTMHRVNVHPQYILFWIAAACMLLFLLA